MTKMMREQVNPVRRSFPLLVHGDLKPAHNLILFWAVYTGPLFVSYVTTSFYSKNRFDTYTL